MADWIAHNDFVGKFAEAIVRGGTAPSSSGYRVILCSSGSIARTASVVDIISDEVIEGTGYEPKNYAPGAGSWDGAQLRYEMPDVSVVFTADGGSFDFNHVVLWQGRTGAANKPVTGVNAATERLTVEAHGGTNADKVLVTSTVANPDGISDTTIYYLKSIDVDTIELYTDAGLTTLRTFADSGSGDITLRFANGYPALIQDYGDTSLLDGQSQTVIVSWAFYNGGDVNGV